MMLSHRLVFSTVYHQAVLQMLHDHCGHQALDHTLVLARERFYWSTMYRDIAEYVTNFNRCQVMKGCFTGPHTQQGTVVITLLDLPCIDFIKINPSKDGREEVLVLNETFSKFNQAFITNNQKAKKVLHLWDFILYP